ncbi:uncharacterized protein LOC143903232 [Temnothorax americanus]|uniref:uncharacterized protein LOC143903232 n=1 Tax=Temnothorax americanus TaxID=1964332 RepID=UPI0040689F2C
MSFSESLNNTDYVPPSSESEERSNARIRNNIKPSVPSTQSQTPMDYTPDIKRKRAASDTSEVPTSKNSKSSVQGNRVEENHNSESKSSSKALSSLRKPIYSRYAQSDRKPFVVHICALDMECSTSSDNSRPANMHPLLIGRIITQIVQSGLQEVKKISKGHVQAIFTSATAANRLIDDQSLASYNLKSFIPSYKAMRTGIIKDIPQSLPIKDLLEKIESLPKPIEVHRLNRRVKIGDAYKYEPSRTVCIKFAGPSLPGSVSIFKVRQTVYHFVQKVKICFSCFRAGHINKTCKSHPRCIYCGNNRHDTNTECPDKPPQNKCINCGGPHLARSFDCPIIINLKKTYAIAASENLPLFEAKKKVNNSANSANILDTIRYDYTNFPNLSSPRRNAQSFFPNSRSSPSDFSYSPYESRNSFSALHNIHNPMLSHTLIHFRNLLTFHLSHVPPSLPVHCTFAQALPPTPLKH